MPAPLGLVIGRNDRWPRTKETPLEGHRGSTPDFSFSCCLFTPLSFLFWLEPQGTSQGSRSCEISKKVWEELEKKEEKYPRGEDFAKRRRINCTEYLIFLLLLSLSLSSFRLEWMVDTKDGGSRSRGKREEKKKLGNGNKVDKEESFCSSSFSPRKNRGTQKTENQDQENR